MRQDHSAYSSPCDEGPVVYYRDGWGVWCLNEVRVPREVVETPGDRLDPGLALKEQDLRVQGEIIRKIGMERICAKLNARVLDAWAGMELLCVDLPDVGEWNYLKTKVSDTYQLRGVHPMYGTVKRALEGLSIPDEE